MARLQGCGAADEFERDPYAVYARLREHNRVHWDGNVYTMSGYAEVAQLLKDARLSVNPARVGLPGDPRADNPVTRRRCCPSDGGSRCSSGAAPAYK